MHNLGTGPAGTAADALAPLLGWDAARREAELAEATEILNDAHGLSITLPARH